MAARHVRLTAQAHGLTPLETPPFLSLFAISPEREPLREELNFEEIVKLSEELGPIEALQLGGEDPFRRELLPEI
ncbi:MAG TPA: hypothetical protein VHZ95_01135, partial [Polyangiales bacterium]|nr:hypothetical protein [Polyangiales bacterium]